ncbi:hypothetical protein C1645_814378 [Glomus cerebriforme]|uniref:Uncharacterized protein n=1 Tax=Glomus cerebriforme TaxID=658196 RepID=A0A397TGB5_9GLOM|nr:hypothetical protein C1645_814378 [Glomus cerebriforme]
MDNLNKYDLINENIALEKESTKDKMNKRVTSEKENIDDKCKKKDGLTQIEASEKASKKFTIKEFTNLELFKNWSFIDDEDVINCNLAYIYSNKVMIEYEKLILAFIGNEMQIVFSELEDDEQLYILITHDECQEKFIMISEFLLETIRRLKLTNELAASYPDIFKEARKYLYSDKNKEAVFAFDNSTNHEIIAKNKLNTFNMNLNPGGKKLCMHIKAALLN